MLKKKDTERKEQENGLEKEDQFNHNEDSAKGFPGEHPDREQTDEPRTSGAAGSDTAQGRTATAEDGQAQAETEDQHAGAGEGSEEERLKQEVQALNDKYLRLFAEFDNFKRRSVKERVELIGSASKSVILALLPVLDDFDRAQKSMESATDVSAVREGIELIIAKFRNILAQQGVKEMESIGTPFNADLHEAVSSIPAPSEDMKGKVVDQLEKGYYLNDKVIRFAKVFVGA